MKTDRKMLDEAMRLLEETESRQLRDMQDWDDWRARRKALLSRYQEQEEPPALEPFVTRRELGEFRRQVGDVVELTVEAIYRAVKHGPNINIGRLNSAIAVMRYGKDETGDDGERGEG